MQHMKPIVLLVLFLTTSGLILQGCSKDQPNLALETLTLENHSKGSDNFNRMLHFCFNEPIKNFYWHTIEIVTFDDFKFKGQSRFFPLASDPDNLCQDKNLYLYVDKYSPTGARQLLATRVVIGNIKSFKVSVYKDADGQLGELMFAKEFKDM